MPGAYVEGTKIYAHTAPSFIHEYLAFDVRNFNWKISFKILELPTY